MVLHQCPFCHKLLAGVLVSKTVVDSSLLDKPADLPETGEIGGGHGMVPSAMRADVVAGTLGSIPPVGAGDPEVVTAYKLTYKCKHCGKEWTKTSTKDVKVPREYVEDEQEKTDYDASREAEEARREERWRR